MFFGFCPDQDRGPQRSVGSVCPSPAASASSFMGFLQHPRQEILHESQHPCSGEHWGTGSLASPLWPYWALGTVTKKGDPGPPCGRDSEGPRAEMVFSGPRGARPSHCSSGRQQSGMGACRHQALNQGCRHPQCPPPPLLWPGLGASRPRSECGACRAGRQARASSSWLSLLLPTGRLRATAQLVTSHAGAEEADAADIPGHSQHVSLGNLLSKKLCSAFK